MSEYYCDFCFYETKKRSDFNKHIKTRKHIAYLITFKNKKKISLRKSSHTATKIRPTEPIPDEKPAFLCAFCDTNYSRLDNLKRHEVKCSKRIIYEKDTELQKQNNKLLKCEQELHFFKQIIQLSDENKERLSEFKNRSIETYMTPDNYSKFDFRQEHFDKLIDLLYTN